MKNESYAQVIVVGAGIAGLTAAWELKKLGIQALVLEAAERVGGRMQSIQIDDALIDCGAQFLSSAYTVIPQLIKETGLSDKFVATNEWVGFVRNKGIAVIHPQKPWHLVSKHVLSIWNLLRLGFNQFKLFNIQHKSLPLNDITAWAQYDNQLANNFVAKNFGESVASELTSAIFNGFYFQSLYDSSAAMAATVLAFSAHHPKTMTLTSGMGSLPRKLADQLNVKTNIAVSTIIESSASVKIISESDEFNADHVILAVPAPIAKDIIQHPDAATLALLKTPYSSSATISLLTDEHWKPPASISSVYGFIFNPREKSKIAALTFENNKCQNRKKEGYLVNVMLSDEWAKQLLSLPDEAIYAEVQADIESVLPHIHQHLQTKKLFRWPFAMPRTPIGRANAVKQYRDSRDSGNRIWLAGDYLGLPWTDSAAQTGIWAANQVAKHLQVK